MYGYTRPIKYIPAETNVAEWINAEAGTGASIESGNHTWRPNWADLQNEAIIKNSKNKVNTFTLNSNKLTYKLDNTNESVKNNKLKFGKKYIFNIKAINKLKSLNLLNVKALNADLAVPTRVVQKLINKNEKQPISSQPNNKVGKLPAESSKTILNKNKTNKLINEKIRVSCFI